jgi:hypothetical protein
LYLIGISSVKLVFTAAVVSTIVPIRIEFELCRPTPNPHSGVPADRALQFVPRLDENLNDTMVFALYVY